MFKSSAFWFDHARLDDKITFLLWQSSAKAKDLLHLKLSGGIVGYKKKFRADSLRAKRTMSDSKLVRAQRQVNDLHPLLLPSSPSSLILLPGIQLSHR